MGKHFNSKHEDGTWRALFGRWHAGEDARALRREAGVSHDTWTTHAKRLGMRIGDLPDGHPAKRRAPPHAERADNWKHPNSLLSEGEWRALFALRAEGVPDTALCARFRVAAATICSQASARGIRREDIREAVARAESPAAPAVETAAVPLSGVEIVMGDPGRTMAAFDGAIAEAGRRADYVTVTTACRAKLSVRRAMFGEGGGGAGPLHPPSPAAPDGPPPPMGEDWADPVLRASQRAPEGDWTTWLFLGGRGAGKTLAGAMWLSDQAEALGPGGRLALIGPTLHDVREVMIEGASGVMALARWNDPKWGGRRPVFETSRRRLVFPNGATALAFSAEEPERLRGPQFSAAWADEFCAWRGREGAGATLALLRMGLRLPGAVRASDSSWAAVVGPSGPPDPTRPGASRGLTPTDGEEEGTPPRLMISTTPKPTAALRRLREEPGCVETHAGTRENAAHLSAGFVEGLERLYGGTKRAAQEIEGKVVESEGALFTAEMLARARVHPAGGYRPSAYLSPRTPGAPDPVGGEEVPDRFERVVVAVDPTATAGGNACGIVVAGRAEGVAWVLADLSVSGVRPDGWGRRVARAAESWKDAVVVAEVNQGGDMVQAVLKASGCAAKVREVRATKGKRVRAEPVAALYEQGRVRHAGVFDALEEELMALGCVDADGEAGTDRADALVWAITDLLVDGRSGERGPRISLLAAPPSSGLTGGAAEWPGHRSTTRALRGW